MLVVVVYLDLEAVVQEVDVEPEVILVALLPGQVAIGHCAGLKTGLTEEGVRLFHQTVGEVGFLELLTALTPRGAELTEAEEPEVLHKVLLRERPRSTYRGEGCPADITTEDGRTVVAHGSLEHIALVEVVGDTPEVAEHHLLLAVGRHALQVFVATFDLTPLRPAVTDLVDLVGRPTRSLALDVLHQVVGRRDPRHQVKVVAVTQAEAIGEDIFPLEHRHQRARGLYGGKVIVIEVSGAEDVVIREVSISCDRGRYLQS